MSEGSVTAKVRRVTVRGIDTSYLWWAPAADPSGAAPLALVLHGFPDTPRSFESLAQSLVAVGYRVAAPWLRGYAPTAVPADGRHQGGAYVADVLALRAALMGSDVDAPALLIGHDIGAAIAYGCAAAEPGAWDRVITMSLPPLPVLGASLASYEQLRRSWYTFFFQHPAAETVLGLDGLAFLARLWRDWSPALDPMPHLQHVREALDSPERLTAALGWYRAGFHPEDDDPDLAKEQQSLVLPTPQPWLYLHGAADGCIGAEVARQVPGAVVLDGVGHFPHLEAPDRLTRLVTEFLTP